VLSRLVTVLSLVMLTLTGRARAWEIALEPQLGYLVGGTSDASTFFDAEGVTGLSRLDYPLTCMIAGGSVRLRAWRLAIVASLATNIDDPDGAMTDEDYLEGYEGPGKKTVLAYTESTVRTRLLLADLGGRLRLMERAGGRGRIALELMLGYRHQLFIFDVYGAEGRERVIVGDIPGPDDYMLPVLYRDDLQVGHVVVQHMLPYVGLALEASWAGRLTLEGELRGLALISRVDDDHILREKMFECLAGGAGVLAGLAARWRLTEPKRSLSVAIGPELELLYIYGVGVCEQRYYGWYRPWLPDHDFTASSLQLRMMVGARVGF